MASPQQNLMRHANQAEFIKNKNPPNMVGISDDILKSASAGNYDFLNMMKIDKTASDTAAAKCRTYTGLSGLRDLALEQGTNRTYYDGGCGWRYKKTTGITPQVNQGALGGALENGNGPYLEDDQGTGETWYLDLAQADKEISKDMSLTIASCSALDLVPPGNEGKFGYCKTSRTAIPINPDGSARFPTDINMGCAKAEIVTSAAGCPTEGFTNLENTPECENGPLKVGCVIKAARDAGCTDYGTLIQALRGSHGDYDSVLKTNPAYLSYNSIALPPITSAIMKDGSASFKVALQDFSRLVTNTASSNKKLSLSSKDLCFKAGQYDEYDFCVEITPQTLINQTNISCAQKDWISKGGSSNAEGYPILKNFIGKSWAEYNEYVTSMNKPTDVKAFMNFTGIDAYVKPTLPMANSTRGAETVWFDFSNNRNVVILKCDIGSVPYFSGVEMMATYNLKTNTKKAYTSAFEIRKKVKDTVAFEVNTSDGFILSKNQNPFEGTRYKSNDWGGWLKQPPTRYTSEIYEIDEDTSESRNVFITKWFTAGGNPVSELSLRYESKSSKRVDLVTDIYLTQEAYAPWLQYEVCKKPNFQITSTGFFEKRWNGPCAYSYEDGVPYQSFDVVATSVVVNTKGDDDTRNKGYLTFNSGSQWYTKSFFHFNAFKTITLLIRPVTNISSGNYAPVFSHRNETQGYTIFLYNNGGSYKIGLNNSFKDITMNEWNLVVIQYVGDENGVRAFSLNVNTLKSLENVQNRNFLFQNMLSQQQSYSPVIAGGPGEYSVNSAQMSLGSLPNSTIQSFTGDVAWVHGFRYYLTSQELLSKEIDQTWLSRWPFDPLSSS
jgi:hypothetical protein